MVGCREVNLQKRKRSFIYMQAGQTILMKFRLFIGSFSIEVSGSSSAGLKSALRSSQTQHQAARSRCALAGRRAPFPGNEPLHLMDGASTAAAGTRCVRPGQEEKLPPPGMRQHDVAESWRLSRNFFPAGEATFSLGLWPYLNLCYVRNYSNFDC